MGSKIPEGAYIDPNWPNPHGEDDASIIIYGYTPSLALALLATILFGLSTLAHAFQLWYYRPCWYFVTVAIGTFMEIVGYTSRTLSAKKDPYNVLYYVISYFFVVCAPVLVSAAIYAILSILINIVGRQYAPLAPKAILITFIICDVLATGVQVAGAASIGKAESNGEDPATANNILLAGLAFQVFSFALFLVLFALFLFRARKVVPSKIPRAFLLSFIAATLLIYVRTCFRLAETSEGVFGNLMTSEAYFGTLEFAPVAAAVLLFNIWHPGRCVPGKLRRPSSPGLEPHV